jgi:hypothetical protein
VSFVSYLLNILKNANGNSWPWCSKFMIIPKLTNVFPSLSPLQVVEKMTPHPLLPNQTSMLASPHGTLHFHLPCLHRKTSHKNFLNINAFSFFTYKFGIDLFQVQLL